MKKIHVLGLLLFGVWTVGAFWADSSMAAEVPQWLVDAAGVALGERINIDVTGEALLQDMNATLAPDALCLEVLALGYVLSNGEDEVVEGECMAVESMTSGVTCERPAPVDLPWLGQLVQLTGGEYLNELKSDGKGEPGWEVTCTALGVKVTDTCTGEHLKPTQLNNASTEEVESVFKETVPKEEEANCTLGGNEEGLVVGSLFLKGLSENELELLDLTVSLAGEVPVEIPQWLVDGAVVSLGKKVDVDVSGEVLLEDMRATLKPDVLCLEVLALGYVLSNGEDEVVEGECMAVESMTSGVTCEKPDPVDLPWLGQLVQLAGSEYLNELKSDGKGEPGWQVTCTALGVKVTDTCTSEHLKPRQLNHTSTEEVESAFEETVSKEEEANCTVGGNEEGLVAGSLFLDGLSENELELLDLTVSFAPEEGPTPVVLARGVLNFGEVSIEKQKSRSETEEFESTTHPVKYEASTLTNTVGSTFSEVHGKNTCVGNKYAAKALCQVEVTFTPELPVGTEYKATLQLEYEDETTKETKLREDFALSGLSAK